ncbi:MULTISPECIES: ABC transporter permease subunit [unclassified Streptomyces]|uniref:ABC transporter permease subunit n=1 Tax=unclassified Streptomyces TaxID=2593676 RepID=UPI000F74B94D|nr:ABC transporter permease subunit [Streptomyces sp. WAC05292]RSS89345.1 transporter [Streptomyces sp. WAC05292]
MNGTLWLAWRQQRLPALAGLLLVAACTVWVAVRHAELADIVGGHDLTACKGWNGACPVDVEVAVFDHTPGIRALGTLAVLLPAAIGMFWGAPLVGREIERGTVTLALTQGAGARHWFAARLGLAALCATALSAAVAALLAWWWEPIANMKDGVYWFDPYILSGTGPAAVAAALFALAAGTAIGLLVRRTLPAMGLTAVAVLATTAFLTFFRRDWVTPVDRITPGMTPKRLIGSGWSAGYRYLTPDGVQHPLENCALSGEELRVCMAEHGYTGRVHKVYPSSDFWTFQAIDTAVYLGLAAALVALTAVLLHRRRGLV